MYIGEEAVATGVCKALTKEDYIASNHRCDGHLIAKGADINAMMAELMGKENGICGGRAGKMHQSAPEVGLLSANGIVGAAAWNEIAGVYSDLKYGFDKRPYQNPGYVIQ